MPQKQRVSQIAKDYSNLSAEDIRQLLNDPEQLKNPNSLPSKLCAAYLEQAVINEQVNKEVFIQLLHKTLQKEREITELRQKVAETANQQNQEALIAHGREPEVKTTILNLNPQTSIDNENIFTQSSSLSKVISAMRSVILETSEELTRLSNTLYDEIYTHFDPAEFALALGQELTLPTIAEIKKPAPIEKILKYNPVLREDLQQNPELKRPFAEFKEKLEAQVYSFRFVEAFVKKNKSNRDFSRKDKRQLLEMASDKIVEGRKKNPEISIQMIELNIVIIENVTKIDILEKFKESDLTQNSIFNNNKNNIEIEEVQEIKEERDHKISPFSKKPSGMQS